MKKTVLFRGFNPNNNGETTITLNGEKIKGKWVKGFTERRYQEENKYFIEDDISKPDYDVLPETVGQWATTLYDGVDIFDEDVIGVHRYDYDGSEYEEEIIGRVAYDEELLCWILAPLSDSQIKYYSKDLKTCSKFVDGAGVVLGLSLCSTRKVTNPIRKLGNIWEIENEQL